MMAKKNHLIFTIIGIVCLALCGLLAVSYFVSSSPENQTPDNQAPAASVVSEPISTTHNADNATSSLQHTAKAYFTPENIAIGIVIGIVIVTGIVCLWKLLANTTNNAKNAEKNKEKSLVINKKNIPLPKLLPNPYQFNEAALNMLLKIMQQLNSPPKPPILNNRRNNALSISHNRNGQAVPDNLLPLNLIKPKIHPKNSSDVLLPFGPSNSNCTFFFDANSLKFISTLIKMFVKKTDNTHNHQLNNANPDLGLDRFGVPASPQHPIVTTITLEKITGLPFQFGQGALSISCILLSNTEGAVLLTKISFSKPMPSPFYIIDCIPKEILEKYTNKEDICIIHLQRLIFGHHQSTAHLGNLLLPSTNLDNQSDQQSIHNLNIQDNDNEIDNDLQDEEEDNEEEVDALNPNLNNDRAMRFPSSIIHKDHFKNKPKPQDKLNDEYVLVYINKHKDYTNQMPKNIASDALKQLYGAYNLFLNKLAAKKDKADSTNTDENSSKCDNESQYIPLQIKATFNTLYNQLWELSRIKPVNDEEVDEIQDNNQNEKLHKMSLAFQNTYTKLYDLLSQFNGTKADNSNDDDNDSVDPQHSASKNNKNIVHEDAENENGKLNKITSAAWWTLNSGFSKLLDLLKPNQEQEKNNDIIAKDNEDELDPNKNNNHQNIGDDVINEEDSQGDDSSDDEIDENAYEADDNSSDDDNDDGDTQYIVREDDNGNPTIHTEKANYNYIKRPKKKAGGYKGTPAPQNGKISKFASDTQKQLHYAYKLFLHKLRKLSGSKKEDKCGHTIGTDTTNSEAQDDNQKQHLDKIASTIDTTFKELYNLLSQFKKIKLVNKKEHSKEKNDNTHNHKISSEADDGIQDDNQKQHLDKIASTIDITFKELYNLLSQFNKIKLVNKKEDSEEEKNDNTHNHNISSEADDNSSDDDNENELDINKNNNKQNSGDGGQINKDNNNQFNTDSELEEEDDEDSQSDESSSGSDYTSSDEDGGDIQHSASNNNLNDNDNVINNDKTDPLNDQQDDDSNSESDDASGASSFASNIIDENYYTQSESEEEDNEDGQWVVVKQNDDDNQDINNSNQNDGGDGINNNKKKVNDKKGPSNDQQNADSNNNQNKQSGGNVINNKQKDKPKVSNDDEVQINEKEEEKEDSVPNDNADNKQDDGKKQKKSALGILDELISQVQENHKKKQLTNVQRLIDIFKCMIAGEALNELEVTDNDISIYQELISKNPKNVSKKDKQAWDQFRNAQTTLVFDMYYMHHDYKQFIDSLFANKKYCSKNLQNLLQFKTLTKIFPNATKIECKSIDYDGKNGSNQIVRDDFILTLKSILNNIDKENSLNEIVITSHKNKISSGPYTRSAKKFTASSWGIRRGPYTRSAEEFNNFSWGVSKKLYPHKNKKDGNQQLTFSKRTK